MLPTAHPVLLLHGLGSQRSDWTGLIETLARPGRRLWAPDLLGHGDQPHSGRRVTVEDHTRHVEDWLRSREPDAKLHILGLSLGSMVALEFAARHPARVASLTLLSPTPDTRLRSAYAWSVYAMRRLAFELLGNRGHARWLAGRLFPRADQRDLRRDFAARWATLKRPAYRACLRGGIGWTIHGRESAIQCPTLMLRGARDFFPAAAAHELAARLPRARVVDLPDLGHAFPVEDPATVSACIRDFLDEADASTNQEG